MFLCNAILDWLPTSRFVLSKYWFLSVCQVSWQFSLQVLMSLGNRQWFQGQEEVKAGTSSNNCCLWWDKLNSLKNLTSLLFIFNKSFDKWWRGKSPVIFSPWPAAQPHTTDTILLGGDGGENQKVKVTKFMGQDKSLVSVAQGHNSQHTGFPCLVSGI